MKMKKMIDIARRLELEYAPPNRHHVSGDIPISIYDTNWDKEMKSLVLDAEYLVLLCLGMEIRLILF